MKTLEKSSIRVINQKKTTTLSAGQKTFNRLIKKINKERKTLETWETTIPLYQKKYATELIPLKKTYDESRASLVKILDNMYSAHKFSKSERKIISTLIQAMSSELIFEAKMDDLKEIFDKYSECTYDEHMAYEKDQLNSALKDFIGVDIDDDIDLNSAEDLFKNIFEKMSQNMEDELDFEEARKENRKKTAKMLAKEAKQQEETEQVSQSIREIFRALAKSLHPDREQDPKERNRKNTLMQRANAAYKAKDLLTLLELQLEVEQIDQTAINGIAESRLKHYNKVLKEQLFELEREIDMVRVRFMMQNKINPEEHDFEVHEVLPFLSEEIGHFQQRLRQIKNELVTLQDITAFRQWLRYQSF